MNPGLDYSGADCGGSNATSNQVPDGWSAIESPDRSTAVQRAWNDFYLPRGSSPRGGCYYGIKPSTSGVPEGISQVLNLVNGESYTFTFDYLIETTPEFSNPPCTPNMQVRLNGVVVANVPPPVLENVWVRPEVTFVATVSGPVTFDLIAGGTCSDTWNFVDGLSLALTSSMDSCNAMVSGNPDNDGDGISDSCDLDDDNDGILDEIECPLISTGNATGSGAFVNNVAFVDWSNAILGTFADGAQIGDTAELTLSDGSVITISVIETINTTTPIQTDELRVRNLPNFAGSPLRGSYDGTNLSLYDTIINGYGTWGLVFSISAVDSLGNAFYPDIFWTEAESTDNGERLTATTNGSPWEVFENIIPITGLIETGVGTNTISLQNTNQGLNAYRTNGISRLSILSTSNFGGTGFGLQALLIGFIKNFRDTDSDGISNCLDSDSDNDRCPDAIEAAENFTLYQLDGKNGQLAGGVDGNGIPNVVSTSGQSSAPAVTDNTIRSGCANTVITNRRITVRVKPN